MLERFQTDDDRFGDMLRVTCDPGRNEPGILVLSHVDTVHPLGTLAGPLPFRRGGIRGYDAVVAAAKQAGAHGATLSGAGSAILAIAPRERAAAVGTALLDAWRSAGVTAELIRCAQPVSGAVVSEIPQTIHPVATELS